MRAGRSVISLGGVCGPQIITVVNQLQNLFLRLHELFFEALDLDFIVFVFHDFQRLMIVKEVIHFAPINFVHGHSN